MKKEKQYRVEIHFANENVIISDNNSMVDLRDYTIMQVSEYTKLRSLKNNFFSFFLDIVENNLK